MLNDMRFFNAVKQAALNTYGAQKPTQAVFGTIESTEPLSICVTSKLTLSGNVVIVPSYLKERRATASLYGEMVTVMIPAAYAVGDTAVLLRDNGGQRFILLGVI